MTGLKNHAIRRKASQASAANALTRSAPWNATTPTSLGGMPIGAVEVISKMRSIVERSTLRFANRRMLRRAASRASSCSAVARCEAGGSSNASSRRHAPARHGDAAGGADRHAMPAGDAAGEPSFAGPRPAFVQGQYAVGTNFDAPPAAGASQRVNDRNAFFTQVESHGTPPRQTGARIQFGMMPESRRFRQ